MPKRQCVQCETLRRGIAIAGSPRGREEVPIQLTSPTFPTGGVIPPRHTDKGGNLSPALSWRDPPEGTCAFALVMDDAESPAGTWSHWVIYGIPGTARALPEGVPLAGRVEGLGCQGTNDFGQLGYGGPCPPFDQPHRYVFRLYALGDPLSLPQGLRRADLFAALHGRVIAHAELTACLEPHEVAPVRAREARSR